jgi:hypothetical protein
VSDSRILRDETPADFPGKSEMFVKILMQVFLFFPGTFVLFVLSFGTTIMVSYSPGGMRFGIGFVWIFLLFLAGFFGTWLGIGDLRKPKHMVIPLSILATGAAIGLVSAFMMMMSGTVRTIIFGNNFIFYIFPLALIVPFLAKGLIDRRSEN